MKSENRYTIKQLSDLADVSTRTLRFYDRIGLLKPEFIGENGYRYYEKKQLLLLQQVLFFKELGFSLDQIQDILNQPDLDLVELMIIHRDSLKDKILHLQLLIGTIDKTILTLNGEKNMADSGYFKGFSAHKQAEYQKYAREHWDPRLVDQSEKRWGQLSAADKKALLADGEHITLVIAKSMPLGAGSTEVQALVAEWHQYINRFYDCSIEIFAGLGKMYSENPDFAAFYQNINSDLPEFLTKAISLYCTKNE